MAAAVPTPGFEGFEKRLEIEFTFTSAHAEFDVQQGRGLRNLSKSQLDLLLSHAECCIVSELENEWCDSYVLSESSFFVYPQKIVLKTCGTTQILKCIPTLLELVTALDLEVSKCKYTRGTFMFPNVQPFPHGCFSDEIKYLDEFFGDMGSEAYILGDSNTFPKWHLYVAAMKQNSNLSERDLPRKIQPRFTMEMCMTELDRTLAHRFYNQEGSVSGHQMTQESGIDGLLPEADICDFSFYPCGYSMNALEKCSHSTIHVTPEDNMSYASYEFMGCDREGLDLPGLMNGVLAIFRPARFAISVYVDAYMTQGEEFLGAPIAPFGYACSGTSRQELQSRGAVVFHTFSHESTQPSPCLSALPLITALECGSITEVQRSSLLMDERCSHKPTFTQECRRQEVL